MIDKLIKIAQHLDHRGLYKESDQVLDTMVRVSQYNPMPPSMGSPMPVSLGGQPKRPNQALGTPYPTSGALQRSTLRMTGQPWETQYRQEKMDKYQKDMAQRGQDGWGSPIVAEASKEVYTQANNIINKLLEDIKQSIDKSFDSITEYGYHPQVLMNLRNRMTGMDQIVRQARKIMFAAKPPRTIRNGYTNPLYDDNYFKSYILDPLMLQTNIHPVTYFDTKLREYMQEYPLIMQQKQQEAAKYRQMYQQAQQMGILPQIQSLMRKDPDLDFTQAYEMVNSGMGGINPMMMGNGMIPFGM